LVGVAGLASAAFFALSGASCSQPAIQCVVAHGQFVSFFAKYELVSGDANCYGQYLEAIGYPPSGEDIAMSTFLQPTQDGSFADFSNRSIALQSMVMGVIARDRQGAGDDEADNAYGIGPYTTSPDDNNICYAAGAGGTAAFAAADLDFEEFDTGEVDPMTMMPIILPEAHYRQEWKNVRVYVSAGVPGTQAVGEMRFEDVTAGCFSEYKFVAIYPSVDCQIYDEEGNGTGMGDSRNCDPNPNPAEGRVFGSGINPDFKTTCDPDLLHCVLTEPPLTGNP
jgi:hypothetical protein